MGYKDHLHLYYTHYPLLARGTSKGGGKYISIIINVNRSFYTLAL
jgi:hypothetical protein